jgi:transposase
MAGPSTGFTCENGKAARVTATDVVWVGIDAGKTSHHAAAVGAGGKRLWSVKVANGQQPIEELIGRAAQSAGDGEVRWAVDLVSPAAALLLAILLAGGQKVVYVPGRVVHGMAQVFRGEGKTDAKDARIIADTARMRSDLTELTATDELVVELTRLTSYRADVMADWVRGINRLRDLLTSIFPALEASFDYSTRSALILVAGYCTPAGIRQAGAVAVAAYLREHGAWAKGIDAMAATAAQAAQEQTVALPGEATTALLIGKLARQLLDLDREIKDTDKLLTSRFRDHPQAAIIESLPGMGPILGAQFLVATDGRALEAFASPGRLASYAGLVPVPRDSGRVAGNYHRPRRYHRPLRNVFYMMALSSLRTEGPSKAFYQRKRDENKIHTQALLALARRLVDVLWALLRDNRVYSPIPPSQVTAIAA